MRRSAYDGILAQSEVLLQFKHFADRSLAITATSYSGSGSGSGSKFYFGEELRGYVLIFFNFICRHVCSFSLKNNLCSCFCRVSVPSFTCLAPMVHQAITVELNLNIHFLQAPCYVSRSKNAAITKVAYFSAVCYCVLVQEISIKPHSPRSNLTSSKFAKLLLQAMLQYRKTVAILPLCGFLTEFQTHLG